MASLIKFIKKQIPTPVKNEIKNILFIPKIRKAKKIFNNSSATPAWLEEKDLEILMNQYPLPELYPYDPLSLEMR